MPGRKRKRTRRQKFSFILDKASDEQTRPQYYDTLKDRLVRHALAPERAKALVFVFVSVFVLAHEQAINLTHGNEGLLNSRGFSPQKSRPCQCQRDKEMLFAIPLKHAVQNTSISIPTPAQVCQFHFHSFYLKT